MREQISFQMSQRIVPSINVIIKYIYTTYYNIHIAQRPYIHNPALGMHKHIPDI